MSEHETTASPRDAAIDYYVSMFRDPELSQYTTADPALIKERFQRFSEKFLLSLMEAVNESTDDSRSLLLHLIDETATDRDITASLRTKVEGFSYADKALILVSLREYEDLGFITDYIELSRNTEHLIALHRIIHAVGSALPFDTTQQPVDSAHPLKHSYNIIGNRPVFNIRDRELFDLTLRHATQSKAIGRLIREHGEVNLPALRSFLEGGTARATESYRLTRDESVIYYTELLLKPELQKLMHANWRYTKGNLWSWNADFLSYLKPFIDQNTDDSRSLLLCLIDPAATEEKIRQALAIQKSLPGLSFADTAITLESLDSYPKSGISKSFADLRDSPKHLIAFHAVNSALITLSTMGSIARDDLVERARTYIGKNQVCWIRDKTLLSIILEHPEHGLAIAQSILESGDIRYPAIHSIVNGEATPLSSGAL
jgi:hypothetical protein